MIELSVIIPCFNEEDNLEVLLSNLKILTADNIEILLVNNGSTDDTLNKMSRIIKRDKLIIDIVSIKKNLGYGHGIMEGVLKAKGKYIGWTHADLQTDPNDILTAYELIVRNKTQKSIVKGKRKGRNFFDSFFTFGMGLVSSYLMGMRLNDINAQPKVFPKTFIKEIKNYPRDFSLDLYLLYTAKKNGYRILEIPVDFKKRLYGEAKGGGSIIGKYKLIKRTFSYILKLKRDLA